MRFRFHPDAELGFQEAVLRYEGSVGGLGHRFLDEVERAIELVLEQPELGVPVDSRLRQFVLRKFPFSLV